MAHRTATLTRWRDWAPGGVVLLINLAFLTSLHNRTPFIAFIRPFALFFLFAAAHSALGYMVNNWGDRALDGAQGKANPFNSMPIGRARAWLAGVGLIALLSGLPLARSGWFVAVWLLWTIAALCYSLPPLRLKARGVWGLVANCAAQYALPSILLFTALGNPGVPLSVLLDTAVTLVGLGLEIGHQRCDRARDSAVGARTFAVELPEERLERVYGLVLLLEVLSVVLITGLVVVALLGFGRLLFLALAGGLTLSVLGLVLVNLAQRWKASRAGAVLDPHYHLTSLPAKLLHESVLNALLPASLAFGLALFDMGYAWLLAGFLVWRLLLYQPDWGLLRRALPGRGNV